VEQEDDGIEDEEGFMVDHLRQMADEVVSRSTPKQDWGRGMGMDLRRM
jgi:hypothetical protein